MLDKKSNIKCSDDFFAKKQATYKATNFKEVKELGHRDKHTWNKEDIEERSKEMYNNLANFFAKN